MSNTEPLPKDWSALPADLPAPVDDGACDHLAGMKAPSVMLPSTRGRMVNPAELKARRTIIYCYPMTGVPGTPLPDGWDMIPGARGCTPQSCDFRDHFRELAGLGADIFGLSTQTTEYQQEMAKRTHLPFELLSDAKFLFCDALKLPTFEANGMRLIKRLTLVICNQSIETVFYPVFPPHENANAVIRWLSDHPL